MYREKLPAHLGSLESEHPRSREWSLRLSGLGLALTALGVGLTAFMSDGFQPHNLLSFSSASEQWAVSLGVGGFVTAAGLGVLALWYAGGATRARVYEHGLVFASRGKVATIFWEDIERFWSSEVVLNGVAQYRYTLETRLGQRLAISLRLAHVRDVGRRIASEVWSHRLPLALEAHARGEAIPFGRLTVTGAGLDHGKKAIAWGEIDAVRVEPGSLSVWKRGAASAWVTLRTPSVPNLRILLALAEKHVRVMT